MKQAIEIETSETVITKVCDLIKHAHGASKVEKVVYHGAEGYFSNPKKWCYIVHRTNGDLIKQVIVTI
jgi:ribosomal protein L21E